MDAFWFSRAVAHHPYGILLLVFTFSTACLVVPFATQKFPDFSDPQLGFEARGTVLSQRFVAWQNLLEESRARGSLTDNPLEYYWYLQEQNRQADSKLRGHPFTDQGSVAKKAKNRNKNRSKGKKYAELKNVSGKESGSDGANDKWVELLKLRNKDQAGLGYRKHLESVEHDCYFCNSPNPAYARVVIASNSGEENLWSMRGVLAQCHIDGALRANPHFPSLCQTRALRGDDGDNGSNHRCCGSWSPANYVALLSNRSSCLGVTEGDLLRVELLLRRCVYYYRNLLLTSDCAQNPRCQVHVPAECYAHDAPYHLIHYLLDHDFLFANSENSSDAPILRSVMLFLPIASSSAAMEFYKDLNNAGLSYGEFSVRGMHLGLKSTLFDRLLVADSVFLLSGFSLVTTCIWLYTGSALVTLATILAVLFSLGISYAAYTLVLGIKFFPFMNLLTVVVAVGIGADDAFIYCKVWEGGKRRSSSGTEVTLLVRETAKHAFPSMFVTTLTTTVAFLASIVSNVTAVNCFSLFSGLTVIANFFLMITWLPASVVISEHCPLASLSPANYLWRKMLRPLRLCTDETSARFAALLTRTAIGLRWFWLTGLSAVAVGGCVVIFRCPGLQLPDSPNFQLFGASHPFEQYDLVYSRRFRFEKVEMGENDDVLPLRFVWGVKPIDNGDYLNPAARGAAVWDESFDLSHPESQVWLLQFCRKLRSQPFYRSTLGPLLTNCFVESMRSWMQRGCLDPVDPSIDRTPCCENSSFPYPPSVLRQCAAEANAELHRTPSYLWSRDGVVAGGIKFLKGRGYPSPGTTSSTNGTTLARPSPLPEIKALVVEYDSAYAYTLSFSKMDQFYREIEAWMEEQLRGAPPGMRGGWFVSRLEFYELQRTLYQGTFWAMGVSMGLALAVLALVTLNPLVSLLAVVSIGGTIVVTVAALVLLGWKLNVLESVAISTAIGLAVDFSLHYGVSYRTSESSDRRERTRAALEQMGGPTLMAAITSGAAGAFMLPSSVLAYIQIGVFLLLVMGVSWIYATLFLCPLLAVTGPSSRFGQFRLPRLRARSFPYFSKRGVDGDTLADDNMDERVGRTTAERAVLSESTLSTSSTICQLHCIEFETPTERLPTPPHSPSTTLTKSGRCVDRKNLLCCPHRERWCNSHGGERGSSRNRRIIGSIDGTLPGWSLRKACSALMRRARSREVEALASCARPSPPLSSPSLSSSAEAAENEEMCALNGSKETDACRQFDSNMPEPPAQFHCREGRNSHAVHARSTPSATPSSELTSSERSE